MIRQSEQIANGKLVATTRQIAQRSTSDPLSSNYKIRIMKANR